MLRELLSEGRADAVVELVTQLVNHNRDLELLLAHVRMGKNTSERVAADQLDLFLKKLAEQMPPGALAEATKKLTESAEKNGGRPEKEKPPKQPSVRRPIPDDLRRVDNPLPVPPGERPCPVCGKERKCVGHETTPVIEYKPGEVFVRNDRREVLACAGCDGEMTRAPMGDKVVSGGAYGSRLVAHLVIDKYWRGMPLYRQGEELAALGFEIPSSSMADQIMWATDLLRPIQKGLIRSALKAHVMHLDATSLAVRDKESPKGIRLGALWAYVGTGEEPVAAYVYASTGKKVAQRPGEIGPEEMLARRRGFVCADASNLFDASFASGRCIEVGCNMHARRYFVKALEGKDMRAAAPVAAFKALYDIEASVHGASPERRTEERQKRSKPVYDELIAWCKLHRPNEPPSSLLGKAIQYLLNHQLALTRFIDDGTLPIDNGIVERLHRIPAVTRRGFLFAGSHAGGERAAIAYSIIASCILADVDPEEYLADLLPRLAREGVVLSKVDELLPAAWKRARAKSASGEPVAEHGGDEQDQASAS